jgi:hypothetical protein
MATKSFTDLKTRTDSAWANLTRQLQGMDAHLERTDAPGEWTTREVLSHLLFEPGADFVRLLERFDVKDLPLVEVEAGTPFMNAERRTMTLPQLRDAIDQQRRAVFDYIGTLSEDELLQRKARIPLFKTFMGTDEIPIAVFVGALFDYHWTDHAGQLAKIRKAVGLPAA